MGLYAGISADEFVPDLGSVVSKEQGVAITLRIFGLEQYAQNIDEGTVISALSTFSDQDMISGWARGYVATGVIMGFVNGNPDGSFEPQKSMDARMIAKLVLVGAGYTVNSDNYQFCPYLLRDYGALTLEQALYFKSKSYMIRDDLAGMIFNSLKLKYTGTTLSIIGNLVQASAVSEQLALNSGSYSDEIIAKASNAVAAYEAAPYSTQAQVAAGVSLKLAAESFIAKFASFPNATSTSILTIRNNLLSRIAAQAAKIAKVATFAAITAGIYVSCGNTAGSI